MKNRKWHDDPHSRRARKEGYQARSVFKLDEIDRREQILRNAHIIVDLGASPGSWTEYCLRTRPKARVVAIDLAEIRVTDDRLIFIRESIESVDLSKVIEGPVDVVLSDMAPKTSGVHDQDVYRSLELATLALETAHRFLRKGGSFVVKVFMGDGFEDFDRTMKLAFASVRRLRPDATRKHSREIYFIGKEFRAPRNGGTASAAR